MLVVLIASVFAGIFFMKPQTAHAGINHQINFQGKLTNPDGTNVANSTYSVRFRFYNDATADAANACSANSCLWEETQSVSTTDGIFNVSLGSSTSLPGSVDFNTASLFLGVKVGSDTEMTPRIQLTAAPYAFNSESLGGLGKSAFVQLAQGVQTDSSANDSIAIDKTNASGNLLLLKKSGAPVVTIGNAGATLFQNATDSANAFQIKNLGGKSYFNVDTQNAKISIGDTTIAGTIQIGNSTTGAVAQTINIGNTTASGATTAINIGATGTSPAGSTISIGTTSDTTAAQAIVIGSNANASSSVTLQGPVVIANAQSGSTATYLCLNGSNQIASCSATISGSAFIQGGNAFTGLTGSTAIFGTTTGNSLQIKTNNVARAIFDQSNNLFVGNADATGTASAPNDFTVSGTGSATAGTTAGKLTVKGGAGATTGNGSAGGALALNGGNAGGASNNAGGNVTVSGGTATGNAAGGTITLAGGSSPSGTNGGVLIKNAGDSTNAFQLQNAAGYQLLNVDSTSDASNLITNGSFEDNTTPPTGWTAANGSGTSTLTSQPSSTTAPYIGQFSMRDVTSGANASNAGARWSRSFTNSTVYSFTLYAKASGANFSTFEIGNSNNNSTDTNCLTAQTVVTGGWTKFSCSFTYTGTTGTSYVYLKQTDATGRTFYIDGVKLEAASTATPYKDSGVTINGVVNSPTAFQNQSDSTNALSVQNSAGAIQFYIDTVNSRVVVGDGAAGSSVTLLQLDNKNTTGDPATAIGGTMYYNSFSNTFRCYENGAWGDCITHHKLVLAVGGDVTDNTGNCTFTNVTNFNFTVANGVQERFHATIIYTAAATTTGIGLAANGPAASPFAYSFTSALTTATSGGGGGTGNDGSSCTASSVSAAATGNTAVLDGYILPSAGGTLQISFASEVNNSAIVIKAGSTLEWW